MTAIMVCSVCGYVLTPFDVACPRCEKNAGTVAGKATNNHFLDAPTEDPDEPLNPVATGVSVLYLSVLALLSFAVMFCLSSLLFALVSGGLKMETGAKVMRDATSGFDALRILFVDVAKVGWYVGIMGGTASALPTLRRLRAVLR